MTSSDLAKYSIARSTARLRQLSFLSNYSYLTLKYRDLEIWSLQVIKIEIDTIRKLG